MQEIASFVISGRLFRGAFDLCSEIAMQIEIGLQDSFRYRIS